MRLDRYDLGVMAVVLKKPLAHMDSGNRIAVSCKQRKLRIDRVGNLF